MSQSASASGKPGKSPPAGAPARRPTSPHLQIWRWHPTMAVSIFHRAAGIALGGALIGVLGFLVAVLAGDPWYGYAIAVIGSLPGKVVLFLATLAFFFHAANGVRHFVWDLGFGFSPKTANGSAFFVMIFAVCANVVLWRDWFLF